MAKKTTKPAGKLRVVTPQTTDGRNLRYDDEGKVVVKETILPGSALRELESVNNRKPEHLRSTITPVAETKKATPPAGNKGGGGDKSNPGGEGNSDDGK